MNIFCYCDMCLFLTLFSRKVKQSFITVGAKRVFSHSLLLRNINSIIFIKLFFFSNNATIIYWIKETNSCCLRIASKAPVSIQQNLYTTFEWVC